MVVALYIYTETESNLTENDANAFEKRVEDAGGLFEAGTCLRTEIEDLGESNAVVNTAKRIELFTDEKISIISSIQNVNDISKIFTDFSQSFTIPATKTNNEIFKHWYENAIENGFDQRKRYDGYIEIDDALFRVGRWQIEGASVKDNRVENYKLTFYGVLKSLKDKFGEDKLITLENINALSFNYSIPNVIDRVKNPTDSGVVFPLISSDRLWQHGGGGVNDITNNAHAINTNELFPAVKVSSIFYAIGEKYGVSFTGNFLTQTRFTDAYLWLKNKETFVQRSTIVNIPGEYTILDMGGSETGRTFYLNVAVGAGVNFFINVYRNGLLFAELGGTSSTVVNIFQQQSTGQNEYFTGNYTFTIQTDVADTFDLAIEMNTTSDDGFGYITDVTDTFYNDTVVTTSKLNLASLMPDMKIADFFSGVLKMFNLTAFSKNETIYTIEQLETWYQSGEIKDFSEYTITDLEFERIKAYKKIDFKYQKCESLINRNFLDAYAREYGDLSYTFSSDGSDYTVELPFENLQFANIDGANLNVGYVLQTAPDYKPYIPKPIILYKYGNLNATFKMISTSGHEDLTTYNAFGQDVVYNGALNSLNWWAERSLYSDNTVSNTLFSNYYFSYLNNLYSLKSRMIKVSMRLPFTKLINLKLNDRLVIRDKRYIINQYTTDLDTFESKFELVEDFRSVLPNNNLSFVFSSDEQDIVLDYIKSTGLTWGVRDDVFSQIDTISYDEEKIYIHLNKNNEGVAIVCNLLSSNGDVIYITQNA